MASLSTAVFSAVRSNTGRAFKFMNGVVFGNKHLLITNALISGAMGALGDNIQQNYDALSTSLKNKKDSSDGESEKAPGYCLTRTFHMTAAGLTTGVVTHYWYILLDRFMGVRKTPFILAKKILVDQVIFSPVNLFGKHLCSWMIFLLYNNIVCLFINFSLFHDLGHL